MVLEAFQWLLSRGLLAPGPHPETVFVTRKGKEIGTAAGLRGLLEQERGGVETATQTAAITLAGVRERAESELAELKIRAESDISKAIDDAKKESAAIFDLARKTAQGISLADVQKQFADAGNECLKRIRVWAALSCVSVATFVVVLVGFMTWWAPGLPTGANAAASAGNVMYPTAIYHAIIRVTLLTAIGAVATFCFRVLRAQMHLREQNLHRERVANSVAAFLGAATSPEQRDVILARVVDAITAFGNSGLLSDNDESMSPAKLILETVPRILSQKP